MAKKKTLDEQFNTLSVEELETSDSLQQALALINQENVISEAPDLEIKKFIVAKKDEAKELSKLTDEQKNDKDLDEIANQADQAFYDLMDIAINTQGKACGDIASAAQSFLNIKLNAKLAKSEQKYKKLNQEIQMKKIEMTALKSSQKDSETEYSPDDDIIIVNPD